MVDSSSIVLIKFLNIYNPLFSTVMLGYMGYWLCYHGFEYGKEERLFKIGIFTLPSLFLFSWWKYNLLSFFVSLVVTLIVAGFWRRNGKELLFKLLHKCKISNDDNNGPIMDTILCNRNIVFTQIFLYLKNGAVLGCIDIQKYTGKNFEFQQFLIDNNKSIAIYVDYSCDVNGKKKSSNKHIVLYEGNQPLLTVISLEEILYIKIRYKANHKRKGKLCINLIGKYKRIMNFVSSLLLMTMVFLV